MIYTVRYAHLKELPKWNIGDVIWGTKTIGIMGNTGASSGAHLHIDCVEGIIPSPWRLHEMEHGAVYSCPKELNFFIDDTLFGVPLEITSYYCDPYYGKVHMAYDVIPEDKKSFVIYWNRSMQGTVISFGNDSGYGYYIHIIFET